MSARAADFEKEIKKARNIARKASMAWERRVAREGSVHDRNSPPLEALRLALECEELSEAAVAETLADPSNWVVSRLGDEGEGAPREVPLLWDAIRRKTPEDLMRWAALLALKSKEFDPWAPWGPLSAGGLGRAPTAEELAGARSGVGGERPVSLIEEMINAGRLEQAAQWAAKTHGGQSDASWGEAVLVWMSAVPHSAREAEREHWTALLALAKSIETREALRNAVARSAEAQRAELTPPAPSGPERAGGGAPLTAAERFIARLDGLAIADLGEGAPADRAAEEAPGGPREEEKSDAWAPGEEPDDFGGLGGVRAGVAKKWWREAREYSVGFGGGSQAHAEVAEMFCDIAMQQLLELKDSGRASAQDALRWAMGSASASAPEDAGGAAVRPLAAWLLGHSPERSNGLGERLWAWLSEAREFDPRARAEGEPESLMNAALIGENPALALRWAKALAPESAPQGWAALAVLSWANGAPKKRELLPAFLAVCERAQLAQSARDEARKPEGGEAAESEGSAGASKGKRARRL